MQSFLRSSIGFGLAIGSLLALSAESAAAQQPQYQAGPAIGSGVVQPGENRSRHFAPPVHIAPGSATALPADRRSMQPNRQRVIVQNGYEQPPQPGLQDRLSQAFRRKEPTEISRADHASSNTVEGSYSHQAPAASNQSQVQRVQEQRVQRVQEQRVQEQRVQEQRVQEQRVTSNDQPNPMFEHSYSVQEPEMPQLADRSEIAPETRRQNNRPAQQAGSSRAEEILDRSISRVTAMDNKTTGRKIQPDQVRQAVMQEVESGDFNWNDGATPQNSRPAISNNNTSNQSPSSFRQSSILSRTSEEFDARSVQDQDDLGTFRPKPEPRNQQDLQSLKDELKSLEPSPTQDDGFQPLPKPDVKKDPTNDLNDELKNLEQDPRSLLDDNEGMKDSSDEEDKEKDKSKKTLLDKGCEEFRNDLLNTTIRDIALDISPPSINVENQLMSISRSWTDRSGNIIATGTMLDMRRGYVILDNGQKISFARLSEADLAAVSEHWNMPRTCLVAQRGSVERCWTPQRFSWTAASLCHKPLYFENIQLERYGHTHGPVMQPIRSVGHFFVSLATLPYHTAIHPANECQYPLGLYRPGDCAPWLKDPIPISLDGMRRQGLVTTGLAFIP